MSSLGLLLMLLSNAITTGFKPDSCPFQNLGEEFGKWLEEVDAFSTDQLGNPRV